MEQLSLQHLFKVNEVEIIYRNTTPYHDRIQIRSSATVNEILLVTWNANRIDRVEQFNILMLDQQNSCLGVSEIATGGTFICLAYSPLAMDRGAHVKLAG